jgi:hypothetical protein
VALVAAVIALGGCDGAAARGQAGPSASPSVVSDGPQVTPSDVTITGSASPPAPPPSTTSPPAPATPRPPSSFGPANTVTDLAITTDGLALGKPVSGIRHGVLRVRVTNRGPSAVWNTMFTVEVPASVTSEGDGWSGCEKLRVNEAGLPAVARCYKGYIGVGQTKVFELGMRTPSAKDGADDPVSRNILNVWALTPAGADYSETNGEDNRKIFTVTRA